MKHVGLTLHDILLKYFTMMDGHALIAKVHQCRVLSPVEVIITNTEEAETMIARMNVHLPAFCYHYLLDKGLGKPYIAALVQESCCAILMVEIPTCIWDLDNDNPSLPLTILTTNRKEECGLNVTGNLILFPVFQLGCAGDDDIVLTIAKMPTPTTLNKLFFKKVACLIKYIP